MIVPLTEPTHTPGSILRGVEKCWGDTEEVRKQVDFYQKECDRLDGLLHMSPEDRMENASDLYSTCWKNQADKSARIFTAATFGTAALVSVPSIMATIAGCIHPAINAVIIVGTGFITYMGCRVINDRIFSKSPPAIVDKQMILIMTREREGAGRKFDMARTGLEKATSDAVKNSAAQKDEPKAMEIGEEPDFVSIGGVKLEKNRHTMQEFISSCMRSAFPAPEKGPQK